MAPVTCAVYVLIDASGNYAVGSSEDAARQAYADEIGALDEQDGFRIIKLMVKAAVPAIVPFETVAPDVGLGVAYPGSTGLEGRTWGPKRRKLRGS